MGAHLCPPYARPATKKENPYASTGKGAGAN